MLPSLRTALRRCSSSTLRSARRSTTRSFSNGGAFRSNSAPSSRVMVGVAAAAGTSYLTWRMTAGNKHVSLDAPEAPKKRKPKSPPQEPEASSSKSTSEFLQEKEEEAIEEASSAGSATSPADEVSAEGEAEGDHPSQGAFNPETGEINWDCPCLGGMAYGPCGEQFREAFSCFVFSEDEPKGINCVEKFKAMQDCFRAHPETYGEELAKDDEEDDYLDSDSTSPILDESVEPSSVAKPSTSTQ